MFVERKQQVAVLEKVLDRARTGFGSSIAITGPMASGKTTLLRLFATLAAERGYLVLSGSGTRAERGLPLGLLNQLCHDVPLQSYPLACGEPIARSMPAVATLVRRVQRTAVFPVAEPEQGDGRRFALTVHATFTALQNLSERTPVLLAIDDLQHADPLSLRGLLYLARRIGHERLVMALCGSELGDPTDPLIYRELLEQSPWDRLRVPALTLDEVTELLQARHSDVPPEVSQACHAATGGNPLLVRALAADLEARGIPGSVSEAGLIATGSDYARAVSRCLGRCDTETQQVLRASALLDKELPSGLVPLARLAGLDTAVVARRAAELEMSGLLNRGRLPHPSARDAVVDSTPAAELGELHLRTARLLHEDGAAPLVIANHLLASGLAVDAWAVPILRVAAEELLDNGDSAGCALARRLLGLANDASLTETDRAAVRALLLVAEWRMNPQQARHRLTQVSAMACAGLLSVRDMLMTSDILLWFGQHREAVAILDRADVQDIEGSDGAGIRLNRVSAACFHPGVLDWRRVPESEDSVSCPAGTRELLADRLETMFSKGVDKHAVTAAEQALRQCRLGDRTISLVVVSLAILIHADQLETAALWCDRLVTQAADREAPTWDAILSTVRADISLRQGHLLDAQCCAESALARLSPESWGAAISWPVSIALMAMTARGRLDDAARMLEYPVPDETVHDIRGLRYLRYLQARGCFYLATSRPEAALHDFLTCGELMDRWNMDQPALMPWRLDAARAHLALRQPTHARDLIEAQLGQLTGELTRTRGIALRLLAATSDVASRVALLRESAEILRPVGSSLELAYTLADLSHAYRAVEDSHRARITVRRAWSLAAAGHADALCQTLLPDLSEADEDGDAPSEVDTRALLMALSDAERRVAVLAAQGSTNRQIANKLFVTVSTVEQHLTRVYRKLRITRRNDLLAKLPADISSIA
ncbi:helix-turn-helix transcriptional regulator [Parafrankia elaeagni]|uniref:helix-turn-helix transcriptional regulator n=1 Tax=Parafrankia elaeagni TaxID=222534 RepID=UPI0003A70D57|nr:LuxR family transcriptional regulator [Parafrankia elaeagni]